MSDVRAFPSMSSRLPAACRGTAFPLLGRRFVPMQAANDMLALPFDALRAQYAAAVQAGFIERSLLASAHVERLLDSLEQLVLGPLARRV